MHFSEIITETKRRNVVRVGHLETLATDERTISAGFSGLDANGAPRIWLLTLTRQEMAQLVAAL